MKTDLNKYLKIAENIASKAGEYLETKFGSRKQYQVKRDLHYQIEEDIKANDIYEKELKRLTPSFGLYTEEGKKGLKQELIWVVDPIEGTSNYKVGNPFWATQICLLANRQPVVSVVYAPVLDQMFTATKGKGSELNGKKIKVSRIVELNQTLVALGKGTKQSDLSWYRKVIPSIVKHFRTFRIYGACGLESAYTAGGMIDAYINYGSKLYDYAPGVLLVREAGGVITTFQGKDWSIDDREILMANKKLHNNVLKVLSRPCLHPRH